MTPLFLIYLLYEKRKAPKREYTLFRLTHDPAEKQEKGIFMKSAQKKT